MRSNMLTISAVALVFGSLPIGLRAADEMVDNPVFKHWSAFKVGATVTQKESIRFGKGTDEADYYPSGVSVKEVTYTLTEVSPQKVVVQSVVVEHGNGSITEHAPTKITYLAKAAKEHVHTSKEEIESFKEGEEDVKVLGKTVHAKVIDLMDKDGDESIHHKMWTSDDVPGGIVKDVKVIKKGDTVISESEIVIVSSKTP